MVGPVKLAQHATDLRAMVWRPTCNHKPVGSKTQNLIAGCWYALSNRGNTHARQSSPPDDKAPATAAGTVLAEWCNQAGPQTHRPSNRRRPSPTQKGQQPQLEVALRTSLAEQPILPMIAEPVRTRDAHRLARRSLTTAKAAFGPGGSTKTQRTPHRERRTALCKLKAWGT